MNGSDNPKVRSSSATSAAEPRLQALLTRSEVARFLELIREDLEAHDGEWSRPGFQALLVYRFGVWRMSIRTKLFRAPFSVLWRVLFTAVRNFYGIELPFTARVGRRVIFEHQHGIVVHGNTEIGDDCIIRQGVTLGIRRVDRLREAPVLGRAVNVGAGAKILGPVHVGDYAEIGANAVVLEDVPEHTLAVGVPARLVTRNGDGRSATRQEAAPTPAAVQAAAVQAALQAPVVAAPIPASIPGSSNGCGTHRAAATGLESSVGSSQAE